MTRCSIRAFVKFHEDCNQRAKLAFVPAYRDLNSRVHIVLANGTVVGRTLCNLGQKGTPYELTHMETCAYPCAHCWDKARQVWFRYQRKAEEHPGRL